MWISRKYEETLRRVVDQFPVAVLTGARQVGKTSLVRKLFPDYAYVCLDVPAMAEQAEKSPEAFLSSHSEPLIIDEVQYAPALFRHIKVVVDQNRHPGRFLLTGSQNFLLLQGVSESLAGRCGVIQMLNLSFSELDAFDPPVNIFQMLIKGGYPELYARPQIDPQLWYAGYLSTYLERDVRNILQVGSLRDFDRFLRAIAIRTGQMLSYSELARDVGISPNTAKSWISVLEVSGQIFLLEPYHRNLGKRLVKSPKLYMCDTGLAAFLMGFDNQDQLLRHPVIGALWETHVVMLVVKHFHALGKRPPLWYWRKPSGDEVDLLIEQAGQFIAIEVKFSENPSRRTLKGFQALERFYGPDSIRVGLVACRTQTQYPLSDQVIAVPGNRIEQHVLF